MEDLEDLHSILSNPKVMYYLEDIQTHSLDESKENLMTSVQETKAEDRKLFFWGIYDRITEKHIGEIGFTKILESEEGALLALGYFIKEEFWKQGYTFEAAKAVISYAFEVLNCYKVETGCVKENEASEKVMIKLDMTKEAEIRKHSLVRGNLHTRLEYGVLREEWKTK
jgi:ribosomal-protein-alanine N-acetyltransferase